MSEDYSFDRLRREMHLHILSMIEDYAIVFGYLSLKNLERYISAATDGWTNYPNLRRVLGWVDEPGQDIPGLLHLASTDPEFVMPESVSEELSMPVSPRDVEEYESSSPAFRLALTTLELKIDQTLMQKGFSGPGQIRIELTTSMTEGLQNQIKKDYLRHWKDVSFEQYDGVWYIYITAPDLPQKE